MLRHTSIISHHATAGWRSRILSSGFRQSILSLLPTITVRTQSKFLTTPASSPIQPSINTTHIIQSWKPPIIQRSINARKVTTHATADVSDPPPPARPSPATRINASTSPYHQHIFIATNMPHDDWLSQPQKILMESVENNMTLIPPSLHLYTQLQAIISKKQWPHAHVSHDQTAPSPSPSPSSSSSRLHELREKLTHENESSRPNAKQSQPKLTLMDLNRLTHHAANRYVPPPSSSPSSSTTSSLSTLYDGDILLLSLHHPPCLIQPIKPVQSSSSTVTSVASPSYSAWKPGRRKQQEEEDEMDDDAEVCKDVHSSASALTPATVINLSTGSSLNNQQVAEHPELVALLNASGMNVREDSGDRPSILSSPSPSHSHSGSHDRNSGLHLLAFVCCHAQRDARCGNRGPRMMSAVEQWAEQQHHDVRRVDEGQQQAHTSNSRAATPTAVTIVPCSHIGGHEFAPNIMLYAWKTDGGNDSVSDSDSHGMSAHQSRHDSTQPSVLSDWFGLMSTDQLPTLMNEYRNYAINALDSSSSSIRMTDTRRRLLQHGLPKPSSTSTDSVTCPACEATPESTSSPSESSSLPDHQSSVNSPDDPPLTSIAAAWRGGMGLSKDEMRRIIQDAMKQ